VTDLLAKVDHGFHEEIAPAGLSEKLQKHVVPCPVFYYWSDNRPHGRSQLLPCPQNISLLDGRLSRQREHGSFKVGHNDEVSPRRPHLPNLDLQLCLKNPKHLTKNQIRKVQPTYFLSGKDALFRLKILNLHFYAAIPELLPLIQIQYLLVSLMRLNLLLFLRSDNMFDVRAGR